MFRLKLLKLFSILQISFQIQLYAIEYYNKADIRNCMQIQSAEKLYKKLQLLWNILAH